MTNELTQKGIELKKVWTKADPQVWTKVEADPELQSFFNALVDMVAVG